MKNNKQTILILPGSNWQVPLVKKCKKSGYRTLVVNPNTDSPAFLYADDYLVSDIFNEDLVVNYCRKEKIDAILSDECDIAMPLIAKLGEMFSLSAIDKESALLFTDKCKMRDFCKENHLSYPEYKLCYTKEDAYAFFNVLKKKMIIKPLDSNSSRGVFVIESEKDIDLFFDEALSFSRNEKAVVLERYINGVEFTVDGIKTPNKHYSLVISQKKHFKHNTNIASELYFSHYNKEFDYSILRQVNDAFINKSGLEWGLTHAEYKYEDGKFFLIEIAARGGGNLISSDIVPIMTGIDNYEYLLNCSLGHVDSPHFSIEPKYRNRVAILKFFDVPVSGGKVKEIEGEDFLQNHSNIVAYKINYSVGDIIKEVKDDAARFGFYIAYSESKEELDMLIEEIENKIQIICEEMD